jgi:DNA-binding MarR family transcriptional regulator
MATPDTQSSAPLAPRGAADPSAVPLDDVLVAFQTLQMQSAHVSSLVASTLGISATDFRALLFIASGEGVTPKRTGDFLELTSGAITNLIDRMVAAELVQRAPHPVDRRSIMLELAPNGIAATQRVVDFYRRAFGTAITPEDMPLIADAFKAIGDALARTAAEDIAAAQPA